MALLPRGDNFRDHLEALTHIASNDAANPLAGLKGGDEGARQAGTASRFFHEAQHQMVKHGVYGPLAVPTEQQGFSHLAKLNLGHHPQHMVLAFEVVEKCPLAHVRGFGDFFHSDVAKPALRNQLKSAPEQPQTRLRAAAFPAPYAGPAGRLPGSKAIGEGGRWR